MCYSALVEASLKKTARRFGAKVDIAAFDKLFRQRVDNPALRIPKALEASFYEPTSAAEEGIKASIVAYHQRTASEWEQTLFQQRTRLADAARKLQTKETKAARESARIAAEKIESLTRKLARLRSRELRAGDARIFPGWYAPVVMVDAGELVIRPARYKCRIAGKPRNYDTRYPGTYNARRDNLQGFWKDVFGATHAVLVIDSFYENVEHHVYEHRALRPGEQPENVVLHFNPQPPAPMTVACLYSRWTDATEDLLSFAAITDEPPAEIAATGHDRCVVQLEAENVNAWLSPAGRSPAELQQLLDQRARPYYAHQLAA